MTPQPRYSFTLYAIGAAVLIGLAALAIAAFTAFSAVMTFWHALFSSGVVEVGAVVESLALARARNWGDALLALVAVIVSVTVSATYNYTQVAQAAAALNISQWELTMLALGPLVALVFLSLNFGRQLRAHEQAVAEWHKARAHAAKSDAEKLRIKTEQDAYDLKVANEKAAQRAHELQLAQLQFANGPQSQRKPDDGATETQGEAQPLDKIPPQEKPARGQSQAAARKLRAVYPGRSNQEYAEALQVNPAQVTRAFKEK